MRTKDCILTDLPYGISQDSGFKSRGNQSIIKSLKKGY